MGSVPESTCKKSLVVTELDLNMYVSDFMRSDLKRSQIVVGNIVVSMSWAHDQLYIIITQFKR